VVVAPVLCSPELIGVAMPATHGKPNLFIVHPEGCCEHALVRAAAWGDVTAAVQMRHDPEPAGMLTDLLEATTEDLIASGLETGRVRVAGWMREGLGDPGLVATARVERLVVDLRSRPTPGTGADGCVGPWLADVMEAARSVAVPVYVAVGCGAGVWAAEVVESGLGGVIAPVAEVQDWKSALRNAAYSA
jgi:hypothetical protein